MFAKVGRRSWIYREGRRNVWVIESTYRLEQDVAHGTVNEVAAFARGYFDAEGGIPAGEGVRFYIQFAQKNAPDLRQVQRSLSVLGLRCGTIHNPSPRADPNYWRFYVAAESHRAFIERIGSWHPRKRPLLERRLGVMMRA